MDKGKQLTEASLAKRAMNEAQDAVDAIVNELVRAVNERLEKAAKACETKVLEKQWAEYGGARMITESVEACAETIRSFKVEANQINITTK